MPDLDWDRAAVLDFIVAGTAWMVEELRDDTQLVDLGLNEDEILELAEGLGDEFDVEFGDSAALSWTTVGDVVKAVLGRRRQERPRRGRRRG